MKLPKGFKVLTYTPHPFQVETIDYGIRNPCIGILLGLGLGKTFCAINIARYRIQNNKCKKVLVLCPVSIMKKWQNEIHKLSEYKAVVVYGKRGTLTEKKRCLKEKGVFYIINYESLSPLYKELEKMKFDIVIADESARYIQTAETKRSIAAMYLGDIAKYKMILTGTLISKKPLNLWSQFRFLDGGKTFGANYWAFRSKYFSLINLGQFQKHVLKRKYKDLFGKKIFSKCIMYTRKEIEDQLPEVLPVIKTYIDMEYDFEILYNRVKTDVIKEIETGLGLKTIKPMEILPRLIRLQQVTSGFIKDSNKNNIRLKHTPKLDALMEEVETIVEEEESVIIWCRFLFSMEMIGEELKKRKIKFIQMSGADSKDKKDEKWNKFQKSAIPVFMGQIRAGGIGIELFKINGDVNKTQHTLFYDRTWVFDDTEQAMGRSDRIGQKEKIRYNHFILKNTIDEIMFDVQNSDKELANEIMRVGVKNFLD